MVPGTKFGLWQGEDSIAQHIARVFAVGHDQFISLPNNAAAMNFVTDGGFGYPAGKIFVTPSSLLQDEDALGTVKQALLDSTFHAIVLHNDGQIDDAALQESPNLHVVDLTSEDLVNDVLHHLHGIKRSIELIWLNAKVTDILNIYENSYVDKGSQSGGMQSSIGSLARILEASGLGTYLLDSSMQKFQLRDQFGEGLPVSIPVEALDAFEFSATCATFRVEAGAAPRSEFKLTDPHALVIFGTFRLFSVPGFLALVLNPRFDWALIRELVSIATREHYLLLRATLIRSQYDCLKSLTEITNIDMGKREVLWEVLERLQNHFQVDGVSIVELLTNDDGSRLFEKTYIHYGLRDFDKFPEKDSFVKYCVSNGQALIINETDTKGQFGTGFAFDPDSLSSEINTPVRLNTLIAPKGDESEASLMFFPLKSGDRVLGAIKLGDFSRPYAFDLHQLQALRVFSDPIVVLIDNIQHIEDLKAKIQRNAEAEQFSEDAESLFFYREIALGVFHQVANYLTTLYSTLQATEMMAESSQMKPAELRQALARSIRLARVAKELIANAQSRGKTFKPLTQQCHLVKDILRPAFEYAERRVKDGGAKYNLEHAFTSKEYLVFLDKELTKESIINILNNAVWAVKANKNTTKHEIFVALRELSDEESVRIEVSDSGIGITKEEWSHLFEPFFTTRPDGTGLGLYFARKIMRELGGDVDVVRSQPGKGTTVEILIPYEEVEQT